MQRFFHFTFSAVVAAALLVPWPSPGNAGAPPSLYVAFVGDFLPGASATEVIEEKGYHYLFDGVRPHTRWADLMFLNLETPLSSRGKAVEGKKYTFRASPEVAGVLKKERVLAVTLANNHILDYGTDALTDTIRNLDQAGVASAGAGPDRAAAARRAVVHTEVGPVSFVAFSNTLPRSYWARENSPGTLYGSQEAVKRAVAAARGQGPVVATFHWGAELMTEPKEYQEDLARIAIDSGASLVVGHHPHVPQPIEIYDGVPILYSLGNFSFGSWSRRARVGLLVIAEFEEGGRCSSMEVHPLLVDNNEVLFSPRPLTGAEGRDIFDPLVAGIDRDQAQVRWDGEKGVIVPIPPEWGRGRMGERGKTSSETEQVRD